MMSMFCTDTHKITKLIIGSLIIDIEYPSIERIGTLHMHTLYITI